MGRRAKKAPVVTKKKVKIAKRFKCPFCANDDVVECKMDFRTGIGSLSCRICGAAYQMTIHHLHEPVDVFSEWLDECVAVQNRETGIGTGTGVGSGTNTSSSAAGVPQYDDDDDDDDDNDNIPTTSGLNRTKSGNKNTKMSAKNDRNNPSIDLVDADSDEEDDEDDL